MKTFKVRLPLPPTPFLYYIDVLDFVGEIGEAYQAKVKLLIFPSDPTFAESLFPPITPRWDSIKLEVVVYQEKLGKQRLDWIMEVLIDTLYTIGAWEIRCEVMEQSIRNGGSIGGYMDVKISESKILPIGCLIDGFEWHK
jgi:hypothetical protein